MILRRFFHAAILFSTVTLLGGCGESDDPKAETEVSEDNAQDNFGDLKEVVEDNHVYTDGEGDAEIPSFKANEMVERHFDKEQKKVESTIEGKRYTNNDFVRHGNFQEFYPDGSIFASVKYENDKKIGKRAFHHPNGKISHEVNYVNGKLEGTWTKHNEDGSPSGTESFKNGLRDGRWIIYRKKDEKKPEEKPAIAAEQFYEKGKRSGTWVFWYPDRKQKSGATTYRDGLRAKEVAWFTDGGKRFERNFKKGRPDGRVIAWNKKGEIVAEAWFKDGRRISKPSDTAKN